MKHTKQSLIEILQQFNKIHNRAPKVSETISLPELPRYKVFEYHFGSWNNAVEAAGLTPAGHDDTNHYLKCFCCDSSIVVNDNVYKRSKTKRFFCSRSCSAKTNNVLRPPLSDATKQKISATSRKNNKTIKSFKSMKRRWEESISGPYTRVFLCTCSYTGLKFYATSKLKVHPKEYKSILHYRYLCKFSFGLSKFPNWFDLSIIQELGMYKASNRGNNLSGASRDHMFSISDAYRLKIDPSLIKHPANCRLIPHTDNQHKNTKSCITLNELHQRIQEFESLYPNWNAR